jgi:hypothetical protein
MYRRDYGSNIKVHFAQKSIDLQARSGRLSADILAVVATDYIRNLREETMKGLVLDYARACSLSQRLPAKSITAEARRRRLIR